MSSSSSSASNSQNPTGNLVTVGEVLAYLQEEPSADTDREALIETLIGSVSDAFRDFARREFVPADNETRRFAYDGSGVLNLTPYELRSIDSIKAVFADGSEEVIPAQNYKLRPLPTRTGTYEYIVIRGSLIGNFPEYDQSEVGVLRQESEIEIVGDWGMEEIPAKVKDAAIKQVNLWLASYVSPASQFDDELGTLGTPAVYLAGAIQAALAPYRRTVLA